jgi:hypothetical protein
MPSTISRLAGATLAPLAVIASAHDAGAQTGTASAHIEVSGAVRASRAASASFSFQEPTLLYIILSAPPPGDSALSLALVRTSTGRPRPGRYQVARTRQAQPEGSTDFIVVLEGQRRGWAMDSGVVTIERVDSLTLTGRVSASGVGVRVNARFTAGQDQYGTAFRNRRRKAPPPPQPLGTPIKVLVMLEPGVEARFDTLRLPAAAKGGQTRYLTLERRSGDTLRFEVKAGPEYKNALATVADTVTGPKGAVVLRGSTAVIASADRDVRLREANRAIYQLYREQLTTGDPVGLANRIMCETQRMMKAHGDSATELMDEAEFLAIDPLRDEAALDRFNRALAGRVFGADCG